MNIVFYVMGAVILVSAFIIFINNWNDGRENLLSNGNGIMSTLLCAKVLGLSLLVAPMVVIIPFATPIVSFEFDDTTLRDFISKETREVYIEFNGQTIPVDDFQLREKVQVPGCYITVEYDYDFIIGHDESEKVLITGKNCSEIDSILQLPQVITVLSGWNVTVDQLAIPAAKGF